MEGEEAVVGVDIDVQCVHLHQHSDDFARAVAAWTEGDAWLAAVLAVIDENRQALTELLAEHVPGARYTPPDATYLAWVDCRELELGDKVNAFPSELSRGMKQKLMVAKMMTEKMIEDQSSALYATARLWDDGIIEPAQTRRVLGLGLSASLNAPLEDSRFGVFRM